MTCNRHATNNWFSRHYNNPEYWNKKNGQAEILTVLLLIIIFFLLSGCTGPQSILDPASQASLSISRLWWGMFLFFSLVFFVVLILWFVSINSKKRTLQNKQIQRITHVFIIGGGILFPSITMLVILFFGIPIGNNILPQPEKNVMRIDVIGHQWFWEIHYPDTDITLINDLHLPLNQPVNMYVTSNDVIHSFWIPRLNGKIDAIPGHTNIVRLQATKPGSLRGQCAEFCGDWHAQMVLSIQVHETDSFKLWLQKKKKLVSQNMSALHPMKQKTINQKKDI